MHIRLLGELNSIFASIASFSFTNFLLTLSLCTFSLDSFVRRRLLRGGLRTSLSWMAFPGGEFKCDLEHRLLKRSLADRRR